MVMVKVRTTTNVPAFSMSVSPTDDIMKVTKMAARKANVNKPFVRLSLGKHWLKPKETVEELGMRDGAVVILHIKNQPIIKNLTAPPALPVFSFPSGGYGFFVDLVSAVTRKVIWRPKLFPFGDLGAMLETTKRKAKCKTITIKFKRPSGETVKIEKGKRVLDYDIRANDQLVVHGLPEDQEPTSPITHVMQYGSGMYMRSRSSRKVVPTTMDGAIPQTQDWLPVGPTNWPAP